MIKYYLFLLVIGVIFLISCSAVEENRAKTETILEILIIENGYDEELGVGFITVHPYVTVDGMRLELRTSVKTEFVGTDGSNLSVLGGQRIIIAGDIDGEYYDASYFELPTDAELGPKVEDMTPEQLRELGIPEGYLRKNDTTKTTK